MLAGEVVVAAIYSAGIDLLQALKESFEERHPGVAIRIDYKRPEEVDRAVRRHGTERPFTGRYNNYWQPGSYTCVCCGARLFGAARRCAHACPAWVEIIQACRPGSRSWARRTASTTSSGRL
mgnify:CR=1 FL=1